MGIKRRTLITRAASGLAIASLATLSLTACGGDSTAGAANSAGGGVTKLRVAVAPIQFETAHVAKEQGMFEKQGLDVEIVNGADPAALLAQVVSGDVDITIGSWINVATSVAQGVPVSVIGGNGMVDAEAQNSGVLREKPLVLSA